LKSASICALLCFTLGSSQPAAAALLKTFDNPGDGIYLGSTSLLPIAGSEFTPVASITDGIETISFSDELTILSVPTTWGTWNTPPFSESSTPGVLAASFLSSVTLTFSVPQSIFGFEAEPDGGNNVITLDFFNGATNIGSISRSISSFGGSLLLAGELDQPITSAVISSNSDFAIAQIRYGTEAPEPGSVLLVLSGVAAAACRKRRQ
jgi:hypothetical protein